MRYLRVEVTRLESRAFPFFLHHAFRYLRRNGQRNRMHEDETDFFVCFVARIVADNHDYGPFDYVKTVLFGNADVVAIVSRKNEIRRIALARAGEFERK